MQRTIQIADFDLPRGAVSIAALLEMAEQEWQHLRLEITRRWTADRERPLARCRLCGGPVYVKVQLVRGQRLPLFAHYRDDASACPWHTGFPLVPDNPRAAQYRGHQESALHRWLCETVAALASADVRCRHVTVERYLRPSIEARGRYPDVYLDLSELGRFAIEIQLSKPFPTEISARHLHYEREGVKLLWLFRELPRDLPQGFRDVIAMQRGNAFLISDRALSESQQRGTLVLGCRLNRDGQKFGREHLVGLDDLDLSASRGVFFEDCRSAALSRYCEAGRAKWMPLLKARRDAPDRRPHRSVVTPAWDSIRMFVPALVNWKAQEHAAGRFDAVERFVELILILFSIAKRAKSGTADLYTSRYTGQNALLDLLNARLSGRALLGWADLVETMVSRTAVAGLLKTQSLAKILAPARQTEPDQVRPGHPVWDGAARIFPEVLDGSKRAEMADLGLLPAWAKDDQGVHLDG